MAVHNIFSLNWTLRWGLATSGMSPQKGFTHSKSFTENKKVSKNHNIPSN